MGPEGGCVAVCLECLKHSLVFRMACVLLESGARHTASVLYHELATLMPWMVGGLGWWRMWLVLLNELGTLVALFWAAVIIPEHFCSRDLVKFSSYL